jgi:uncharacterized protein YndB with AHSA1/START domain
MTLTYEGDGQGKTTHDTDVSHTRFVEIVPNVRIVHAVEFESDRPGAQGVMTITWRFADAAEGVLVSVEVENAPSAISEADHEAGVRSSLKNLERMLREQSRGGGSPTARV